MHIRTANSKGRTELSRLSSLPSQLSDLVEAQFDHDPKASMLFAGFLRHESYRRKFCLQLMGIARGAQSCSWDVRRVAILMLEHQILKLGVDKISEFSFLFEELGIKNAGVDEGRVNDIVLKEGYSTTKVVGFAGEFRRRLDGLKRVHSGIRGQRTSKGALRDFIHASRADSKLSLARYLLTVRDVVDQVLHHLNNSTGVRDLEALSQPQVRQAIADCLQDLPDFESQIAKALCEGSKIYWVSESTSSVINSMVEYPLGTVAVVIKPPGSDIEFEIKRAGVRGQRPLDAVYMRDGSEVPPTHRLHGGSMAYYLRWEAVTAASLSRIYRLIHQTEAPISTTLSVSTIYGIPVNGREEHIVRYFSESNGTKHSNEMGGALRQALEAFRREEIVAMPSLPGDLGLATQFLGHVKPGQALLVRTSSFRLDRLASYLSPEGAAIYFDRGLHVSFTSSQARQFADELLEEVLGVYVPPNVPYENHDQYIKAALENRDNRATADRNYLSIMNQIGQFWGTILGIRSYSYGESFVARNVGLKRVWNKGEWKVKILFMDNDVMYLTGIRSRDFNPATAIPGMVYDERHIWGFHKARGDVKLLQAIYNVDQDVESEGHSLLRSALRAAYRKTHDEISHNSQLQRCFSGSFVKKIRDWDQIVVQYLNIKNDASKVESWRRQTESFLQEKRYPEPLMRQYLGAVERHAGFLQKYSFLYDPDVLD